MTSLQRMIPVIIGLAIVAILAVIGVALLDGAGSTPAATATPRPTVTHTRIPTTPTPRLPTATRRPLPTLTPTPSPTPIVPPANVLRETTLLESPQAFGGTLATLDPDSRVYVLSDDDNASDTDYLQVRLDDGTQGWVLADDVDVLPITGRLRFGAQLLVSPVETAETIVRLDAGTTFTFLEAREDYYRVRLEDGQEGWLASNKLRLD